jgi:hypothetical protein
MPGFAALTTELPPGTYARLQIIGLFQKLPEPEADGRSRLA